MNQKQFLDCSLWKQAWLEERCKCSHLSELCHGMHKMARFSSLEYQYLPFLPLLPKKQLSLNLSESSGIMKNGKLAFAHYLNTSSKMLG